MTTSGFLRVKINLKSQGNRDSEDAARCFCITCRVRHPFVQLFQHPRNSSFPHLVRIHIMWALGAAWSCLQASAWFCFGALQSFAWPTCTPSVLLAVSCPIPHSSACNRATKSASFCVPQKATFHCNVWVLYLNFKESCYGRNTIFILVVRVLFSAFFRGITVVTFLGAMDMEVS